MTNAATPSEDLKQTASPVDFLVRKTRSLIFGAAFFFGTALLCTAFMTYFRVTQVEGPPIHRGVEAGQHLRVEYQAFRLRFSQALLSGREDFKAKAEEAYEILISRVASIESNSALKLPKHDPQLLAKYTALVADIRGWEPLFALYSKGDTAAGTTLFETVDARARLCRVLTRG
jgi:hypothetical protein